MALVSLNGRFLINDGNNKMSSIIPMIVKVDGDGGSMQVPVTPHTTSSDVIACCRDPGDEFCDLIAVCPQHGKCPLRDSDHPLEILQRWGSGRLILRYTVLSSSGGTYEKKNGMKEPDHFGETLPDGVLLTLSELREMACRQQTQIDTQHQLLAAKEQRLRYLKEQEARQHRVQAESERLRRLRDRVDAQELKLRKLRALRGQTDHQKQNNISLTSDLDSIRALFNEKEKELSMAVAKVEELTRQLEELRRGRTANNQRDQPPPASVLELDKLRRELMYRNKLNEQQNQRLSQQREALTARQEEMSAIDKRISELQERLHKKRLLNQQLANQISAASHKAAYHQLIRLSGNEQNVRKENFNQAPNGLIRGNIAAVEPYNHFPLLRNQPTKIQSNSDINNIAYQSTFQQQPIQTQQHIKSTDHESENGEKNNYEDSTIDHDLIKDFNLTKSDSKYQTLPYNTKFTVNLLQNRPNRPIEPIEKDGNEQIQAMTVHSAPLNTINKNIATSLNQINLNVKTNNLNYQKPISSVAPTSIQHVITSNIYQTSSIKVQPVEPHTTTTLNKQSNLTLSPPQSSSTPNQSASEPPPPPTGVKPVLPPKPVIKTPPRQSEPAPEPLDEPTEDSLKPSKTPILNIIKAKPLTIKKEQFVEQPKLRNVNKARREINVIDRSTPPPVEIGEQQQQVDEVDKVGGQEVALRCRKGNLKQNGRSNQARRVSFDPLALLLDASLEGELELVRKTATQVTNPSAANDEGITALHNAICAGHLEIVKYLVGFGCDVNAQDSDGWTPLHCAASCNNLAMVKFLVEHGACIFATTLSDHETAAEKCEEDEEGFDGCSEYLYSVQEKLGILSNGVVYAVFDYNSQQADELSFKAGQQLTVLRKGDENEREWWWSKLGDKEGYVPRNLLGLYPRVNRSEE